MLVVRFNTPGYNYPVPCEEPYDEYSSHASANAEESFLSYSGSSWSDMDSSYDANVCIKAFTKSSAVHVTKVNDWHLYR